MSANQSLQTKQNYIRLFFSCSTIFVLIMLLPNTSIACNCKAHFEIRKGSYKPDIPVQHFESHHVKGNSQNQNQCRRDAREQAQSCMSAVWRDRWENINGGLPAECQGVLSSGGPIFRGGSVPRLIKRDIERTVCQQPSEFGGKHAVKFDIFKRTYGGRGCGPNLKTSQSRFLSKYTIDCLAIRDRENRQGRFLGRIVETRIQGYDRPGSDINNFSSSNANHCQDQCEEIGACRSWTWVPGNRPGELGHCWIKNRIPMAKPVSLPGGSLMISGTKESLR